MEISNFFLQSIKTFRPRTQTLKQLSSHIATSAEMTTYSADYITNKLKEALGAKHINVEDLSGCCGMKFDALIVSPQFDGMSVLQRQRLVNKVLEEEMKHIHAFTMKTLTPSQWSNEEK